MIITFDLDAISSRSTKNVTVETYLHSRNVVLEYLKVMANVAPSNPNFQKAFDNLYGLNASVGMKKTNFYNVFNQYYSHTASKYVSFKNILDDLKRPSGTWRCETSFGSKLLHTIDCDEPIIDDKVIGKLRACPYTAKYFVGTHKTINNIDKAVNLHRALKVCYYDCLIPCAKAAGYFDEFDKRFSAAASISEVKKIDFYLWAM